MKYVILLPLMLVFECCNLTPAVHYPRIVHNVCGNAWAVETGTGRKDTEKLFWGINKAVIFYTFGGSFCDTAEGVKLGDEFVFSDSLSAWANYHAWKGYHSELARLKARNDSLAAVKKHIDDSIYTCKHTYQ